MRILLADDHPLYAEALGTLIERNVPGAATVLVRDLEAVHLMLAEQRFDLVIIDLNMPGMNGLAGVERTLSQLSTAPLILVSGAASHRDVAQAITLGVKGFIPKTLPSSVLIAALHVVMAGGTYLPTDYAQASRTDGTDSAEPPSYSLTSRETSVMAMLATGQSNKEIGRALELQEITVKLHVRNIFRKLGVRNRVEATNVFGRTQPSLSPSD